MRYFPLYYDMQSAKVGVVGGGTEAMQKLRLLLKTPAQISVIATEINDEISKEVFAGRVTWLAQTVDKQVLAPFDLLYAAGDDVLNQRVFEIARELKTPLNVVDAPELCDFITPAIVDRAPITVAIGSEGTAPVLVRMIKTRIEALLQADIGKLALKAQGLRETVTRQLTHFAERKAFWESYFVDAFSGLKPELLHERALKKLEKNQQLPAPDEGASRGFVSLVGGGPGPSDLLTFRAAQALQSADVIIYDRLIDASVLEVGRRDAKRIFVGKTPGETCTSQDEINQHMIVEAVKGQRVVRLKCGDPLIFGRAGEEMLALEQAQIDYEVVPGVTAASACAAEAKIPLTMREDMRALVYLTGHSTNGLTPYDWAGFTSKGVMLVLYMGVKMAPKIQANLLTVGACKNSKITIIENGCHETARTVETTLGKLSQDMRRHEVRNPAIILISIDRSPVILDEPEDKTERSLQSKALMN